MPRCGFAVLSLLLLITPVHAQAPATPASVAPKASSPALGRPELPGVTTPTPAAAPADLPPAIVEARQRFDTYAALVKQERGRWQLWAGPTLLKDFGDQREQAFQARRLVADLNLNEHGAIGTPTPVMEFWLSNGEAPPPPSFARDIIPFDPKGLRIENQLGAFYLRDEHQLLFNFGPYEADAKLAVTVLQRYGFNEVGFIGAPNPSMTYLVKSQRPRLVLPGKDATTSPRVLPQQTPRHPFVLPKLGAVGERTPFDPMRAELSKTSDGWHLIAGPHDLGNLGNSEYAARQSLQMLLRYPLNEYVRIGTSGFGFYLSRGQAPRGVPIGVRHTSFDPKLLAAKQVKDQWVLSDGKNVVASFPASQASDAKLVVQVLQHFGFDAQCDVGGGLHYLAKER